MNTKDQMVPKGDDLWGQTLLLESGLQAVRDKGGTYIVERPETRERFQLSKWQMAFLGSFSVKSISDSVHVIKPQFATGEVDEANVRVFCEWLVDQKLVTVSEQGEAVPQPTEKASPESIKVLEEVEVEMEELSEEDSVELILEENIVDKALHALDTFEAQSQNEVGEEVSSEDELTPEVDGSNIEVVDFSVGESCKTPGKQKNRRKFVSLIRKSSFYNPVLKTAACLALMFGFLKITDSVAFAISASADKSEVYIGTRAIKTETFLSSAALPREITHPRSIPVSKPETFEANVEISPFAGPLPATLPEVSSALPENLAAGTDTELDELQGRLDDTLIAGEYFYNISDDESYLLAIERIAKLSFQIGEKRGIVSPLKPRN